MANVNVIIKLFGGLIEDVEVIQNDDKALRHFTGEVRNCGFGGKVNAEDLTNVVEYFEGTDKSEVKWFVTEIK